MTHAVESSVTTGAALAVPKTVEYGIPPPPAPLNAPYAAPTVGWSHPQFVGRPEIFASKFNCLLNKDGGRSRAESTAPGTGVFSCP